MVSVLDTNVLLAGLSSSCGASYKLLTILNDSRWQLNISTALVFEYEEIFKREKVQTGLSDEDIDDVIKAICAIANKRSIFYLWRPSASDPDDDFIIDLAVNQKQILLLLTIKKIYKPPKNLALE